MPASPTATAEHIKDVNTRYHDAAADEYDAKWGIDFGEIGQRAGARRSWPRRWAGSTGRPSATRSRSAPAPATSRSTCSSSGVIERPDRDRHLARDAATPGGDRRARSASRRDTVATEAEELPFEDESFDLVFGHAVLHHIPDLDARLRRVPPRAAARRRDRLLRRALPLRRPPGGAAEARRHCPGARPGAALVGAAPSAPCRRPSSRDGHALEGEVDVHAFAPADLRRLLREAGFEDRRVGGEELLANAWGWGLRTVESSAEPESVPLRWRRFAFRSYIALQGVDTRLLEPRLPAELFYNLLVSGRKPA